MPCWSRPATPGPLAEALSGVLAGRADGRPAPGDRRAGPDDRWLSAGRRSGPIDWSMERLAEWYEAPVPLGDGPDRGLSGRTLLGP